VAQCIVAVPVGSADACASFERAGVEVIVVCVPDDFLAVGRHYEDFTQTSDEVVLQGLREAASALGSR
jgi:putative phosphoribosyl transferase